MSDKTQGDKADWDHPGGPRPCPFCAHEFNTSEAETDIREQGGYHICPNCDKRVVYSLEIYPGKDWRWGKPFMLIQD